MILAGGRACLPVFRCDIFERHYPRTRRRDNLCQLILGKIEKTVNVRLRSGCLVVLIAARAGDLKKVKSLVNDGVDPDVTSANSYTALAYAAAGGHLEMMQFLIEKGADVNKPSRFKKTPLCVVVGTPHLDAAKLLVSKGAKVTLMNNNFGLTHEAVFWRQPKMLDFVLNELKVDPNLKAPNGSTGLHWAIWRQIPGEDLHNQVYLELIKVFLENGGNPMLRFTQGDQELNALESAAEKGLEKSLAMLKKHMAEKEN